MYSEYACPQIVWDPDTKRWRNVDGDGDESERPPPPPPKTADLPHVGKSVHACSL